MFGDFAFDLFLAANINVPADQFRGEPDVLTTFADRQRELIFVHDNFHLAVFNVGNANLVDLGGRKGVRREDRRLV